ncbi:helix-turn-helix domain-containing protein [Mesorhizobium sp. M0203]|uniref:helix-turn-helix domain-containing protein n=1 Tax=Mesorhizobium sp. M0203 TaxID=2956912 RepID=UPI00333BF3C4
MGFELLEQRHQRRGAGADQVRYEMLRRVSIDNMSVTVASDEYGVSRPTYYQARASFDAAGIAGLIPKKPGPRGPHKIDDEVLAFLQAQLGPGEPVRARELAKLVRRELDVELHPRRRSGPVNNVTWLMLCC